MFFKTLNFEALVYSLFLSYDVGKFLKNRFSVCHVSIFVCVCIFSTVTVISSATLKGKHINDEIILYQCS